MRRTLTGKVTRDRNPKTRRVDVERVYQHAKYKKIVRDRTVCHVHDENNESQMGDIVEIAECRPRSATKRWELVRVVKAAGDLASQLQRDDRQSETAAPDAE